MAKFSFEGDVDSATKPQLDFISEVLENRGFKGSNVKIEPAGNAHRIVVTENGETFNMIAKLATEDVSEREDTSLPRLCQNEHNMYTKVLPKFDQMQKSADVPEHQQFTSLQCYGSSNEAPHEVILLSDLKERNFNILKRIEPFSSEDVKFVLKNFAIFHALSYATRHKEPDTYAVFQKDFANNFNFAAYSDKASVAFTSMLESQTLALTDARYEKIIKGSLTNLGKYDAKIRKLVKKSKYTVIQHGGDDFLLRFEGNVAVQCVLINFQEAKENSPVYDIMVMLFSCTTHKQRSLHFHNYIDYYHNQLDLALQNFDLKVNLVYPRDRLDADMKLYGKYIFATDIITSNFICKMTEKIVDMCEVSAANDETALEMYKLKDPKSKEMFKIRVEGLVDSFIELGFL